MKPGTKDVNLTLDVKQCNQTPRTTSRKPTTEVEGVGFTQPIYVMRTDNLETTVLTRDTDPFKME